jgi:hypothetical protein
MTNMSMAGNAAAMATRQENEEARREAVLSRQRPGDQCQRGKQ